MATEAKDKFLSADDILAVDDIEVVPVDVPEWKGKVHLRTMSADEATKFTEYLSDPANKRKGLVRIVALCLCDEKGNRLFPDGPDSAAKLEKLRGKNVKAFVRLQKEAMRINGYEDETKALENAKND